MRRRTRGRGGKHRGRPEATPPLGSSSRSPMRIRLRLPDEVGESLRGGELPFVIGVISPLSGGSTDLPPLNERRFRDATPRHLDALVRELAPRVKIEPLDAELRGCSIFVQTLVGDMAADANWLSLNSVMELRPQLLATRLAAVRTLLIARRLLAALRERLDDGEVSAIKDLEAVTQSALHAAAPAMAEDLEATVAEALKQAMAHASGRAPQFGRAETLAEIQHLLADLDEGISTLVEGVRGQAAFRELEASWRGLAALVACTERFANVQVKVLEISLDELRADSRTDRLELSHLYRLVYTEEYGNLGGKPYALLVLDFEIGGESEDFRVLEHVGAVGEAALAPVVVGLSPGYFEEEDFMRIGRDALDLQDFLDSARHRGRLEDLRDAGLGSFVVLTAPRLLARGLPVPAGVAGQSGWTEQIQNFRFVPRAPRYAEDTTCLLWSSGAFAVAALAARAFDRYGWSAAMTSPDLAGVFTAPYPPFQLADPEPEPRWPVEVAFSEEQAMTLLDAGIAPFVVAGYTASVDLLEVPTLAGALQRREKLGLEQVFSVQLPVMLAATRIAHYLKVMMRERIGDALNPVDLEAFLNRWLAQYVIRQDDVALEIRAERPLREGRVSVRRSADDPEAVEVALTLTPHYQVEGSFSRVDLRTRN